MRRAADLYPGEAKTDHRDTYVIADTGRTRRKTVHWLDVGSDDLLDQLRILNGFDVDLAADQNRTANRLRDALTSVSPVLKRGRRVPSVASRSPGSPGEYPTLTALRDAGQARIMRAIKTRSPRLADKPTDAVSAALAAQRVTVPAEATFGRVIAELAGELDRMYLHRKALESRERGGLPGPPFRPPARDDAGDRAANGIEDPRRDR